MNIALIAHDNKKELMAQFNFQGHPQWAIIQEPAHYYTVYNKTKFFVLVFDII